MKSPVDLSWDDNWVAVVDDGDEADVVEEEDDDEADEDNEPIEDADDMLE